MMTRLTAIWDSPRGRAVIWQVLAVGLVMGLAYWLVGNVQRNLATSKISSGFDFLWSEAGLPIGEMPISYTPLDPYARAYLVGFLNTLKVAAIGIVLSTILGTLIGIARLSPNWILARLTLAYVEIVRGIPLLLQLLIIYTIMQSLPPPRGALRPVDGIFLSNRGLVLPALESSSGNWIVIATALAGLVAALIYRRRALRLRLQDGRVRRSWPAFLLLGLMLPALVSVVTATTWQFDYPRLQGFNIRGGTLLSPEFAALLAGLTLYSAAFIAEIVRSGILAVGSGQWEAAQALGLSRLQTLRTIVLPQALRVIIPPMTSQYLNLTKNSSLAVAIGYQDIVSIVNTSINQTGQAIEGIAIIMMVYLAVSLTISLFMNWYNRSITLVGR
jgi:general L-amino acid transport system permease protein